VHEVAIPVHAIKGRGAADQPAHRFSADARSAFDDGWDTLAQAHGAGAQAAVPTRVQAQAAGSAISRNQSPDIHFDYGLNPYRGCEHGCVYCYARPTHSYLNLSPGLDFETRIFAKTNLAQQLSRELQARSYVPSQIVIGSVTDAYQPAERQWRVTRDAIELLARCDHPLAIVTKGSGVERDIDLLAAMARKNLAAVYLTITTLDAALGTCTRTACQCAVPAPAHDSRARRRRHPGRRQRCAADSIRQRRHGKGAGGIGRGRRHNGLLHRVAIAMGAERHFPAVARPALPATRCAGHGPHP
jgi:hypothetical protein